jgi:hypothetical protein
MINMILKELMNRNIVRSKRSLSVLLGRAPNYVCESRGYFSPQDLVEIRLHVIAVGGHDALGYWATNRQISQEFVGRLQGQQISPRAEGTNALRHHTSCAFIYSSKRQPADNLLQRLIPTVSDEAIERARETEDIAQFAFRGAIRMADFAGQYRIYVYDRFQADVLRDELARVGMSAEVTGCADAGIMDVVRGKSQRKPVDERSQAEREEEKRNKAVERMRAVRAVDATAKKADGTYRPRGRPKKATDDGESRPTP